MVGIVSGSSLGLGNSSLATLGQRASQGNASQGRGGEQVFVNVATGNLVIAQSDDQWVAHGGGYQAVRTYNSQGLLNDDNGDNWSSGFYRRQLALSGQAGQPGSSITLLGRDGGSSLFTWDAASSRYVGTDGAGAYDRIESTTSGYVWTDGQTQNREFYAADTGRLDKSVDASGNTTTYGYDADGNIAKVLNPGGEALYYDYAGGLLTRIRVVDSQGATAIRTSYAYDARNRLASVTVDLTPADGSTADGKVYRTTYTYDGDSHRVATIGQSDGTQLAIEYVQLGADFKVASLRDALGQTFRFGYDAAARTTQVTDPTGKSYAYGYDAKGQLLSITAPASGGMASVQRFEYNANGDLVRTTDPDGRSVFMAYDAMGNPVLQRDALGNTVARTYNGKNQLLTETVYTQPDPDGDGAGQPSGALTTRYVYDDANGVSLRFVISAEGRVSEYRRNAYGETVAVLQHHGAAYPVSGLARDAAPSVTTVSSWVAQQNLQQVQRTDYVLDFRGQVQTTTTYAATDASGNGLAAGSSTTRYVYDPAGRLLQTIDGNGGATVYAYDGLGRLVSTTDSKGQLATTTYDDAGSRTVFKAANGLQETRTYDRAGRLTGSQRSDGTSADLGTSTFAYDTAGRLRLSQDATGVKSWILYDEAGRKAAEVGAAGELREYLYNASGQLTRTIAYATPVDTRLLTAVDGSPAEVAVAALRPAAAAGDRSEWIAYDAAGRRWKTVGSDGSVTENVYDGASRLIATRQYARTISTTSLGNAPAGSAISPAGDAAADRVTRHFYDADGLRTGTLDAEGYLVLNTYDAAGRLATTTRFARATDAAKRASGTLQDLKPATQSQDIVERRIYNEKNQLVASVDGAGYLTAFEYDANGNLAKQTRWATALKAAVLSLITSATPVAQIRPAASAQDRVGLFEYDALGRLAAETDYQGTRTEHAYDAGGNRIGSTVAAGTGEARTRLARYDSQGRLVAELSAEGARQLASAQGAAQIDAVWSSYATTHTYDRAGRRSSTTDANGLRTLFFYNTAGQLTHTINALGEVTETRYDVLGQVSTQVRYGTRINPGALTGGLINARLVSLLQAAASPALDQVTRYTYNATGTLASVTDALGFARNYVYNAFREETQRSEATGTGSGSTTVLTRYDRRGQVVGQTRDAGGLAAATTNKYDAFGNLVSATDALGRTRTRTFDKLGREVSSTDALWATLTTKYDAFSRVVSQVNAEGNTTTYAYDAKNRTVTISTDEGLRVKQTYNRHGDMVQASDARGNVTSYRYDAEGRQTGTSAQVWHFDTNVTETVATAQAYDRAGRLIETVDANGTRTTIAYDAASRVLTRTVDGGGLSLATRYAYDPLGRQIRITQPGGSVTELRYDARGQLLEQVVDPAGLALSTRYAYDAQGHTLEVTRPEGTLTRYSYDSAGRRIREQVDPAGLNLARSYTYDQGDNLTSSVDANGNTSYYLYDAENRQTLVVDGAGAVQATAYDALGRVSQLTEYRNVLADTAVLRQYVGGGAAFGPGTWESQVRAGITPSASDKIEYRTYDANNQLQSVVSGLGEVTTYLRDGNGRVMEQRSFVNRIAIGGAGGWTPGTFPTPVANDAQDQRVRMAYDALGRVIATVDGTGAATKMRYDAAGNVVERVRYARAISASADAYDESFIFQLAAQEGAAGNVVQKSTYDRAGRLAWSADGAGSVTHYAYDGDGNVVKKVRLATALAAGQQPQDVALSAGDLATDYVYDAAGRQIYEVGADGAVIGRVYDRNGNLRQRTEYATPVTAPVMVRGAVFSPAVTNYDRFNIGNVLRPLAGDRSTSWVYDGADRQVLEVGALGAVRQTIYGQGRVTTRAYASAIDLAGLALESVTLAQVLARVPSGPDRASTQWLDGAGRVVRTVDAGGAVVAREYDGAGQLVHLIEYAAASGTSTQDRHTRYGYDAAGRLVDTTDALGQKESTTYDALGRKTSFTNKAGSTWTYGYDAAGRLVRESSPPVELAALRAPAAQASGPAVLQLDPDQTVVASVVTLLGYDAFGNLVARTEAAGRPEERTTRYEYDALGRQTKTIFPPVAVYQGESAAALLDNGRNAAGTRTDAQPTEISSETRYDALGNAVAGRAAGSTAWSYKAYDRAGHVAWDVDALGYVTGYTRNAFGDAERLVRYAQAIALPTGDRAVLQSGDVRQAVQAGGADREILTGYDRLGRVVEVQEPFAFYYDSETGEQGAGRKTTRNSYDALGNLVAVATNAGSTRWATTRYRYDLLGRRVGTTDALGYVTTQAYDAQGQLTRKVEYASAGRTDASAPDTGAGDRVTDYTYDLLGRKTTETRRGVAYTATNAGAAGIGDVLQEKTGDLATRYAYDALGNLVRTTDALGGTTYQYYDVLGRVRATITPAVNLGVAVNGQGRAPVSPLTEYRRDAHGNALVTTQYAGGATVSGDGQSYTRSADAQQDRVSYARFDVQGHTLQTTDAAGASQYYTYDAQGRLAKEWQTVTAIDDAGRRQQHSLWRAYAYDALGRQTHSYAPLQSGGEWGELTLGDTEITYNGFGEVTRRRVLDAGRAMFGGEGFQVPGAGEERYEYDNAGRVWRSNAGDGVMKVLAYNLQGQQTVQLVAAGDIGLGGYRDTMEALTAQAGAPAQFRRTDMRYDLLGRLVQTLAPDRASDRAMGITARQNLVYGVISQSEVGPVSGDTGAVQWRPYNQVDLVWRSLQDLGSGDVRITLQYLSDSYHNVNQDNPEPNPPKTVTRNIVVSAEEAASGYSFKWQSPQSSEPGIAKGISAIQNIKVEKLDVFGNWATLYDVPSPVRQSTPVNWSEATSPGYLWSEAGEGRVPIYRYYNRYSDSHYFSTQASDRERLLGQGSGWLDEGIAGYVSRDAGPGLVPLYRAGKNDTSVYTTDADEYSRLVGRGWTSLGIDGYIGAPGLSADDRAARGLVRLYSLQNNVSASGLDGERRDGLYTTSLSDRNALLGVNADGTLGRGENRANPRTLQLYASAQGQSIEVSYPQDLVSELRMEVRAYGSSDADWKAVDMTEAQRSFGAGHRIALEKLYVYDPDNGRQLLSEGSYEYRLRNAKTQGNNTEEVRDVGTGSFTLYGPNVRDVESQPTIPDIGVAQATIDGSWYDVLQWPQPAPGQSVSFRWRAQGSSAWAGVRTIGNGIFAYGDGRTHGLGVGMQGVALNMDAGSFEYEIVIAGPSGSVVQRASGVVNLSPKPYPEMSEITPRIFYDGHVSNLGIAGYVWSTPAPDRKPLYRYYFPYQGNDHHITTADLQVIADLDDRIARDAAAGAAPAIIKEGVLGYVQTAPSESNQRLYQYIYGGDTVFRLTTDAANVGSFTVLDHDPSNDDGFAWNADAWYQNAYQDDGYISRVPVEGTQPLYAVYDGNSVGSRTMGDYLTSTSEAEILQLLGGPMVATQWDFTAGGIRTGTATIDGQVHRVLQWPKPFDQARVTITSTPSIPGGTPGPALFWQGDGRSQFNDLAVGAPQGFVLDALEPGTTYRIQIQVEHAGTSYQPPYIARRDVEITLPRGWMPSVSVDTGGAIAQLRAQTSGQGGQSGRPVTVREYDRWGNVVEVDETQGQGSGTLVRTTEVRYDANDQVVEQRRLHEDANFAQSWASTRIYYDALGRQVGLRDANGNVNAQVRDLAGNVVQESHADGGRVDYAFNAFGDKVSAAELVYAGTGGTTVTNYAYDKRSRLVQTTLVQGDALRYRVNGMDGKPVQLTSDVHGSSGVSMGPPEAMSVLERNEYDEAGRKVRVVNGNEEATRYRYDRAGNVVMSGQETVYATAAADAEGSVAAQADANAVASPLAYVVRYRYDALGRKIGQGDAAGMNQAWTYDAFGHLIGRTESKTGGGTVDYTYVYNRAGDLMHEGNGLGKSVDYRYDGAGQRTEIRDNYLGQTTRYGYDLAGNRTSERVEQKTLLSSGVLENVVYQDNHLVYDAQRRLRAVFDGRADVRITYDLAGNRSQVTTHVINTVRKDPNADIASVGRQEQEVIHTSTTAYGYDAMNRQTSSLEQPGGAQVRSIQHIYAFDLAGNRTEDKIATVNITATQGDQTVNTRFEYHYDALHRLTSYRGYGVAEDQVNQYDGAGRVVYSNSLVMRGSGNKTPQYENRYNRYDAMGKLQDTRVVVRGTAGDVVSRVDVAYHDAGGATGLGYDAAGNLKGNRQVTDGDEGKATTTRYEYQFLAGSYQQTASTAQREGTTATTKTWRDANGFVSNIEQVTGVGDERFNRAFVNDAQGNAIYVNQGAGHVGRIQNPGTYLGGWVGDSLNPGHVQRQLVANGEVLARYGDAPDSENPPANAGELQKYVDTAEFRLNAAPLQLKGANLDAIAYTVVGGETLKDIARNVLGDATLWWRIAEANGLAVSGDGQLAAGQTLRVPKLALNANNVETFQPYDPSRVTGSLDAVLPAPAGQGGGCGGLGKIIMVAIAVVVTVYTAGLLSGASGALGETLIAGVGAMAPGGTLGIAEAAIAGAAGSIASQAVGNAIGAQQGFSWKSVALSALGSAVTNGLGTADWLPKTDSVFASAAMRQAVSGTISQGVGTVLGLQPRFDWKGVVAGAVGAGVGASVGQALQNANAFSGLSDFGTALARGTVSGFAGGLATAVMRGGRVSVQQVATDAFGNALGESLANVPNRAQTQGEGPWSAYNYRNGSDRLCCTNQFEDGIAPTPDGFMPWRPPERFEDDRSG
ncbi:YD repeat-containing protein [Paracidovorax anthurii]